MHEFEDIVRSATADECFVDVLYGEQIDMVAYGSMSCYPECRLDELLNDHPNCRFRISGGSDFIDISKVTAKMCFSESSILMIDEGIGVTSRVNIGPQVILNKNGKPIKQLKIKLVQDGINLNKLSCIQYPVVISDPDRVVGIVGDRDDLSDNIELDVENLAMFDIGHNEFEYYRKVTRMNKRTKTFDDFVRFVPTIERGKPLIISIDSLSGCVNVERSGAWNVVANSIAFIFADQLNVIDEFLKYFVIEKLYVNGRDTRPFVNYTFKIDFCEPGPLILMRSYLKSTFTQCGSSVYKNDNYDHIDLELFPNGELNEIVHPNVHVKGRTNKPFIICGKKVSIDIKNMDNIYVVECNTINGMIFLDLRPRIACKYKRFLANPEILPKKKLNADCAIM